MDISTFRSIEISSWASFVSQIEELSQGLKEVWYRGQPSNWPLRPHLLRHFLRGGIKRQTAMAIENQATKEFKRAAHLHLPIARLQQLATDEHAQRESQGTGLVAWWTVMRHHGAPTRLLDWTLSPYVAAYFACEPVLETTNRPFGVVWVLDFGSLRAHMDARYAPSDGPTRILDHLMVSPEAPDDLLPLFNEMPTERMLAQQGCFTVCRNVLGDHGEIIRASVPAALTCLRIPDGIKAEFRWRLRQVNLTAYTLFGELDGLGRHTDEAVTILVDQHSRVGAV